MRSIQYRGWELQADPTATRAAHAAAGPIGPDACTCSDCRNFAAARDAGLVYPSEVAALLTELGIDPVRETELAPFAGEPDGRRLISGWLHAVGRVVAGPEARVPLGENSWTLRMEALRDGFEIALFNGAALAPDSLRAHPLVQIEFLARVPWVLPEPNPEPPTDAHAV